MKISARAIAATLRDPGAWRILLLHGEDAGLIRERATEAAQAITPDLDDPFRIAILGRDAQDRMVEEYTALSLVGGRRVVWVRDGRDGLTGMAKECLARTTDTLLIIEAPGLDSRSKLRALLEKAKDCAVIACYPEEGRALEGSIRQMLSAHGVGIDPDALSWFAERASPDRAATRAEVEKLFLFAGKGGRLTLEDVQACIGDAASVSLEDAAFAAMVGDREGADLAIERAMNTDRMNPIGAARALLSHIHRLRRVRLAMDAGQGRAEAMSALKPPVFFKRTDAFGRAVAIWSADALMHAAVLTQQLELACKQTGSPDIVLCKRHVARLVAQARVLARQR
ncbi:DNA polymerase III subunit delta [Novacetimonas maltaceti]|uniref:DNA-directed DNA polymerase n=1 Tax=Novacetimonas maltaceti TaxID=1203393 RepID=A0A2S3W2F1_9PROT|nr:DNA polymerase III subunit delta [Novacetimonas maltaceti]POF63007.1 DNA polymerase III subunit delta [Novacetimonas maltaceti]PYD59774.1 DNA polymerase III subunit delta [Novacetimonas maltaceti]